MLYPAHDEKLGDLLKGGVVSVLSARDPVYEPGFEGFFKNTSSVGIPLIHHGSVLAMAWSSVYDPERPFDEGAVEAARHAADIGAVAIYGALETQRLQVEMRRQREAVTRGCAELLSAFDGSDQEGLLVATWPLPTMGENPRRSRGSREPYRARARDPCPLDPGAHQQGDCRTPLCEREHRQGPRAAGALEAWSPQPWRGGVQSPLLGRAVRRCVGGRECF